MPNRLLNMKTLTLILKRKKPTKDNEVGRAKVFLSFGPGFLLLQKEEL